METFKREHPNIKENQVRAWIKVKDAIQARSKGSRVAGAGRPRASHLMEEILFEFVFGKRMKKEQVKRSHVKRKAIELAQEMGVPNFKASDGWLRRFFARYELTLRRTTNLTRLADIEVVQRAVNYFSFLRSVRDRYRPRNIILMDETAVFFETTAMNTVDVVGARHVVMRTTGYASMRITSILAVRGNGNRVMPATIFKGKRERASILSGCYTFTQPKAWVEASLICEWIDLVLPKVIRGKERGLIIWDACRSHISKEVKAHCRSNSIDMAVIPGGMTSYLQVGDFYYYKHFKDVVNTYIEEWKDGPDVDYTARGNPKPPRKEVVNRWVSSSWKCIDENMVRKGLKLAGLYGEVQDTYIAHHDVYGEAVLDAWKEMEAAQQESFGGPGDENPEDANLDDEMVVIDSD